MLDIQTHQATPEDSNPGSQAVRRVGPAWHTRTGGLHLMKVKGSFREMGRQHGELLREFIPSGPMSYFSDYLEKLARPLGPVAPLVRRTLQHTVGRQIQRQLPEFARSTLEGVIEGSGVSRRLMLDAATMPDACVWAVSKLARHGKQGPAVRHRLALSLGCSSAVAWGSATADGKLLHARNFDYQGVASWPRSQAVIFHEPDSGQRYVSVSAAGVPLGGVTAMNEAGLSLTVHQHMFTDATRLGGTPIGIVGDIVMREAKNLDDAERILRSHTPIGCWTYIITDAKTREVLCFEENPDRQVALRVPTSANKFSYANIFIDPELGSTEQNLYPSYWRHNSGRHARLDELLDTHHGGITPQTMAGILGDTGTGDCRLREAIAMVMTVASVVFSPEDGLLWVGTGEAPTSRNRYEPFSLTGERHAPEAGALSPANDESPEQRAAFDAYRRSYIAYTDDSDLPGARELAEQASQLWPEQPLFHNLRGLLALQATDSGAAARAFGELLRLGHADPERVGAAYLWRGRARDLSGDRKGALGDYRTAIGHPVDPAIASAAHSGLRHAYREKSARRIAVEYSFADVAVP